MIIDDVRNALVDSGKFERVRYKGDGELELNADQFGHAVDIKVVEYEGLGALFG